MSTDQILENRVRRVAARRGYRVEKSRRRDPQAIDFGGFMVMDAKQNTVVLGGPNGTGYAYSASLAVWRSSSKLEGRGWLAQS